MNLESFADQSLIRTVDHLPIVSSFCRKIDLVNTINRLVPTKMNNDVGTTVLALVLDTLSGRSPLYRLEDFASNHDTGLLLGRELESNSFNDTSVGRAMDVLFDYGTESIFSEVAFRAACISKINMQHVHFDTTSINLWGDYSMCEKGKNNDQLQIVYGYSKDHRPDLKQFMIEMFCVGRNIPIYGKCIDGNSSDKTVNNKILSRISDHMAKYGLKPEAFIYIADSAMVTEANLEMVGKNHFITRLPFNYKEADRAVSEAVNRNMWVDIGTLAGERPTAARPVAQYRATEVRINLYGKSYRGVVVHSSAHDKRRQKKIERQIKHSHSILSRLVKKQENIRYACLADAQMAAEHLSGKATDYHSIEVSIENTICYAKGRPPKNGERNIDSINFSLKATLTENKINIGIKKEEAGCFILLTNVPIKDHEQALDAKALLEAYKDQHGIERNFSFLKDPLIVNDIFLKKPERVEVLGMILLISLLVWNLIEHDLREHVKKSGFPLPGWEEKKTYAPTSFMMSKKFTGIQTITNDGNRVSSKRSNDVQNQYLSALGLSWEVFSNHHVVPKFN